MPWWDRALDTLRARFAVGAGPDPQPGTRAEPTETPHDGWRDVPRLQRTLAEPIAPVAINDRFRDSLAAFANPSFLAPLTHQVEPSAGGLVAGLVSPGRPQTHGGPELVVPQRAAARPTPGVQRLATWSTAIPEPELTTVPLEYPHQAASETSRVEPPALFDPPVTGSAAPTGAPDLPVTGSAAPTGAPDPPVPASSAPTAASDAPAPTGPPQVQRSPVADTRSAELHPLPTPVAGSAALAPAGDPHGTIQREASATGAPSEPASDKGVEVEPSVTELEVVTPEPPPEDPAAVMDLPVASPPGPAWSPSPRPSDPARPLTLQRSAVGSGKDAPTLGERPASAPRPPQTASLLPPVGPPDDPPVQRITYVSSHPGERQSAASHLGPIARANGSVDEPTPRGARADLPTVQQMRELPAVQRADSAAATSRRSLSTVARASRSVVGPASHSEPGPATALTPPSTEARGQGAWLEVVVSRLEDHDHPGADFDEPGFTEVPLVVAGSPVRPGGDSTDESMIDHQNAHTEGEPSSATAYPNWSDETDGHAPIAHQEPLGPAVPVEPWTQPASAMTSSTRPGVSFAQASAPITAVQRQAVGATSSTPWADPTVPLRRGAETAATPSAHQPPLVVSRRAAANPGSGIGPRPGEGMSFERMFSGTSPSVSEAPFHTENDHVSVQRQSVDSGPSVAEPSVSAATESQPAPTAAAVFPGGTGPTGGQGAAGSGANLDEMARRLYEPLAARLREELWLDRERAGLMSDV